MPNPDVPAAGKDGQNDPRDEVKNLGRYHHLFSIKRIGKNAAQEPETDKRKSLEKTRNTKLH